MKEGLEVEEGKVELTIMVLVTLIEQEKVMAIYVFVRLSCQKNTKTSGKTSLIESGFRA